MFFTNLQKPEQVKGLFQPDQLLSGIMCPEWGKVVLWEQISPECTGRAQSWVCRGLTAQAVCISPSPPPYPFSDQHGAPLALSANMQVIYGRTWCDFYSSQSLFPPTLPFPCTLHVHLKNPLLGEVETHTDSHGSHGIPIPGLSGTLALFR